MKRENLRIIGILFSTLMLSLVGWAQVTPAEDAFTDSESPGTNYGANALLNVNAGREISYIQFNLASVPTGAILSQATLKLFVNGITNPGSFTVYFVTSSWAEGTITNNLAPVIGSAIATNVPVAAGDANQYVLVDITPAVYEWLNGSQPNNGIALIANGPFSASFDSKENATTSHAPELDVVLTAGGGTISGVLTSSGSGLMGGGLSGTLNLSLSTACAVNQLLQWSGSSWVCANASSGTITSLSAGTDLTGGGNGGTVVMSLDTTRVPQLSAANTFTGNQTINGNLNATGIVSGSSYQIGSNLFAFGSYSSGTAFLGFAGNPSSTGVDNTGIGLQGMSYTASGGDNSSYGAYALQVADSTAGSNTAMGYGAGTITGSSATAIGALAVTDGSDSTSFGGLLGASSPYAGNTGIGNGTFGVDVESPDNTAIGYQALYNNQGTGGLNTAVGYLTLYGGGYPGSTGTDNLAVGYEALGFYTSGSLNTGTGYLALSNVNSGTENTGTGSGAVSANTGNENTGIGYGALDSSHGSDVTCIGYECIPSGENVSESTGIGAHTVVTQSNSLVLGDAVRVGIGTPTPSSILTIARGTGHPVSDGWETYSSRRWKIHVHTLPSALEKVVRLRGVSYDLRDSGKHEIGVIAEEVGAVVPEVVSYETNGREASGVDYGRLTALLIEAVKQQQRDVIRAQKELKKLTFREAEFEANLISLERDQKRSSAPSCHSAALLKSATP